MGRKRLNYDINIPLSYDDINLETFSKLKELYNNDNKPSIIDIVAVISNKDKKYINQMPSEVFNLIINKLQYLNKPITNDIKNEITINGETYYINYLEKLKTLEFIDTQTVKDNLPAILGIICRKKGEIYDDEFIAEKLNDRIKMYNNQPITKIQPLINFFLTRWNLSENNIQQYLDNLKDQANRQVSNIENSLKNGTGKKHLLSYRMKKLSNLKKQLKSI